MDADKLAQLKDILKTLNDFIRDEDTPFGELAKWVLEKPDTRPIELMGTVSTLCVLVPGLQETFNMIVEETKREATKFLTEGMASKYVN